MMEVVEEHLLAGLAVEEVVELFVVVVGKHSVEVMEELEVGMQAVKGVVH